MNSSVGTAGPAGPALAGCRRERVAILVSEFMLQQTPVARVVPIWLDWVARWPTPSATAAASPADVLRAWGKLGYPRRAKRLHECATVVATQYDDTVPDDVDTLLGLPGSGPTPPGRWRASPTASRYRLSTPTSGGSSPEQSTALLTPVIPPRCATTPK